MTLRVCPPAFACLIALLSACTNEVSDPLVCDDLETHLTGCGLVVDRDACLAEPELADELLSLSCDELNSTADNQFTMFFSAPAQGCRSEACWNALWISSSWRNELPNTTECSEALSACDEWVYTDRSADLGCGGRSSGDHYCDHLVKSCLAREDNSGVASDGRPTRPSRGDPCDMQWLFSESSIPSDQVSPAACEDNGTWTRIPGYRSPGTPSDLCTSSPDGIFADCCRQHDLDWLDCDLTFDESNDRFLTCMRAACEDDGQGGLCRMSASMYEGTVSSFPSYWRTTQRIGCYCQ